MSKSKNVKKKNPVHVTFYMNSNLHNEIMKQATHEGVTGRGARTVMLNMLVTRALNQEKKKKTHFLSKK